MQNLVMLSTMQRDCRTHGGSVVQDPVTPGPGIDSYDPPVPAQHSVPVQTQVPPQEPIPAASAQEQQEAKPLPQEWTLKDARFPEVDRGLTKKDLQAAKASPANRQRLNEVRTRHKGASATQAGSSGTVNQGMGPDVSLVAGGGQEGQVPYLVNLSEDPYLEGCLVYFLKGPEDVTVGSADGNKIRLHGLGIKSHHCVISNEGNQRLFVRAVAPGAGEDSKDWPCVFLNGRRVTEPVMMKHQDRLLLGHACAFRAALPLIVSELRDSRRLGEDGGAKYGWRAELGQVLAKMEHSSRKEFQHLRKSAEELELRVGPDGAFDFVRAVDRSMSLVEEANRITRELNRESLVFALQVLADLWSGQTGAPEFVVAVLQTARTAAGPSPSALGEPADGEGPAAVRYVWSLQKFEDRLQAMRDIYEELNRSGLEAVHERLAAKPYLDPWKEDWSYNPPKACRWCERPMSSIRLYRLAYGGDQCAGCLDLLHGNLRVQHCLSCDETLHFGCEFPKRTPAALQ